VLTQTGVLSRRNALTFSNKGLLLLVGDYSFRQFVLCEKDFGWMFFWEFNPECSDRFGWWPLWLREKSLRLKASMTGEGGPCPFWIIPWHLPYNWGKARKTLVRVAELLETTCSADLAAFLGTASAGLLNISPPRLPVGDFSQPLVGVGAFQVAELWGSPHQPTLSRNSQSALWCGRRRMESPNPREFACY
jgi:hypothetical protein